jgi:hypothetical protein
MAAVAQTSLRDPLITHDKHINSFEVLRVTITDTDDSSHLTLYKKKKVIVEESYKGHVKET